MLNHFRAPLLSGLPLLKHRRVLFACLLTLCVGLLVFSINQFTHWRQERVLEAEISGQLQQTKKQLFRTISSRRGTLTFIRDTLNREPNLSFSQLQAIGASASEHTRHLLGTGLTRYTAKPIWWDGPQQIDRREFQTLNASIIQRSKIPGIWSVPSTHIVDTESQRTFLVMMEPLRTSKLRNTAVVGVFDAIPLLEDFFSTITASRHLFRIVSGDRVLYEDTHWIPLDSNAPNDVLVSAEDTLTIDAMHWVIQVQPGETGLVQTLSWISILVITLSAIAGFGGIGIIWLLATRAYILQQAVIRRTAALRRTTSRLRQLATTDELTGLFNRRFFLSRWNLEFQRARRYQRPLACLMIDVNGFKEVNDKLGHPAGDQVLKTVAETLKNQIRNSDLLARFGGDEFIIALPETAPDQAATVADKLRKIRIPAQDDTSVSVTLSVGIGTLQGTENSPAEVLKAADGRLYRDKRQSKITPKSLSLPAA